MKCECCGTKFTNISMIKYIEKFGICKICDEETEDENEEW